jgi:acetyl esterase/lipase
VSGPRAFVVIGPQMRLDRAGIATPAPGSPAGLLRLCHRWAGEVGWSIAADPSQADALVIGPGVAPPPVDIPVALVPRARGVDGFRWALRHVAFSAEHPAQTVPYGRHADQVADLRRPAGPGPHPVAMLLHGGFWSEVWGRDLMDGLAVDLVRRGWATWNVEYRRVGAGGGWPATGKDVLAALRFPLQGTEDRILVGHSAGAQLALWAAGEMPGAVRQVVSLAGLCDLDSAKRNRVGGDAVDRLLEGEPPSVASPIDRLPMGVPVVLAHGAGDPLVPASQSRRYAEAAAAAGDPVELVELDTDDHFALIDPAAAWPVVADRLRPH